MKTHILLITALLFTTQLFAMEYETVKLAVWKKGEAIYGQEFIAANETVVSYLETLQRPTEKFQYFKYECQIKGKESSLSVNMNSTAVNSAWVNIITVYDMKDCKKLD